VRRLPTRSQAHSLDELIALGTLTPHAARVLEGAVVSGLNVLVAGGTQAKKTTLATVTDLYSRRLLGAATGLHPDAELAGEAIKMAVVARGGAEHIAGVIFHTDRGSTYTAEKFTALCRRLGIRQSMGRVGSCFDNAAAEAFFSSLEWEVLSRHEFDSTAKARAVVIDWCYGFYNHQRRHSAAAGLSPINYEIAALNRDAA
jgi:transposase InsO family protein